MEEKKLSVYVTLCEKDENLHPEWVTGFCDGEGCFHVSFTKRPYRKIKVEVRPSFSVVQQPQSKALLVKLQQFFKCGAIRYSKKEGMYRYEVRSIADLVHYILPHFRKYALQTYKSDDFSKFEKICLLLHNNHAKNLGCLTEIIESAFTMNFPGKRYHQKEDLLKLITS